MKLDADNLRAEAEAHRARMESPLWTPANGKSDESWTAPLNLGAHDPSQPSSRSPENQRPARPQSIEQEAFLSANESMSVPRSRPTASDSFADGVTTELLPRLEALDQAVEKLTAAMYRRPREGGSMPGWLERAAGNPHTYDAPDGARTGVCVRVLPTTYDQLQQIQRRMGLRTVAGAWEFLLRLGLAAAERLPVQRPP